MAVARLFTSLPKQNIQDKANGSVHNAVDFGLDLTDHTRLIYVVPLRAGQTTLAFFCKSPICRRQK